MRIHWHNPCDWPTWMRYALFLMFCLIVALIALFASLLPLYHSILRHHQAVDALKAELQQQYLELLRAPFLQNNIEVLQKNYWAQMHAMPTENSASAILDDVTYSALHAGLKINLIKPG